MEHIGKSFGVVISPERPTESILPSNWFIIDAPVPGLPIIYGFKCSACDWLFGSGESLRVHCVKKHQEFQVPPTSSDITSNNLHSRVHIQRLFTTGSHIPQLFPKKSHRCYIQVMYPSTTTLIPHPSTSKTQFSSHSVPPLPISTLPPHISALGWIDWLQSTHLSPDFLMWLVALPVCQKANTSDKVLERVECGLWETNELLKEYLTAAEEKLESLAQGVRDAIRGQ
jgi:hypothetical protein